MDLNALRGLVRNVTFATFPVEATVTRPEEAAITTTAHWLPPLDEDFPHGREYSRSEPRRVIALRRDEVLTVPRGTVILAAEEIDGDARAWQMDGMLSPEPGHFRVIVVPKTD